MNLLDEAWMPVRHQDGSRHWVAPPQLGDPRIAAFDACRPDFNGALAQFAIGLLQTCNPVEDVYGWREWLKSGPSPEQLRTWLEPVREAFVFDGNGARFMQDFELREADGDPTPIAALLIDTPGENAIKNNSDHFVKRGRLQAVCPHCAALALFTLQLNAPSGGAGHRTGLRGGGPLTTLLMASGEGSSLWTCLWLNVSPRADWLQAGVEPGMFEARCRFPWLAPQSAQQPDGGQVTPLQTHPDQVFWAMPRRIRLLEATTPAAACDLCGRDGMALIGAYINRNQGLNYKGSWRHPLSPYYETKEGWLPLHPQPDGLGYRHWAGWVLGFASEKRRIEPAYALHQGWPRLERQLHQPLRLWAFGFDMENMKARCWYDSTLPLYHLADLPLSAHQALQQDIKAWIEGAEQAARYLQWAVRDAWFGHEARGDLSHVEAAFWAATEPAFYKLLAKALAAQPADLGEDAEREARDARALGWLTTLQQQARRLFDEVLVGVVRIERQNPARVAAAHQKLQQQLYGDAIRKLLNLPVLNPEEKAAKKKAKSTAARAASPATPTATA